MDVRVEKITTYDDMREAAEMTVRSSCKNLDPLAMYLSEHSPIRTQIFKIFLLDVPVAYSTHFIRHHVGVDHWALSQRPDRGGEEDETTVTRLSPTKHLMWANAQALINMARLRICHKAHPVAREIMRSIHMQLYDVDDNLASVLRPNCLYKGGICYEFKMCGKIPGVIHWKQLDGGRVPNYYKWEY